MAIGFRLELKDYIKNFLAERGLAIRKIDELTKLADIFGSDKRNSSQRSFIHAGLRENLRKSAEQINLLGRNWSFGTRCRRKKIWQCA